MVHTCSQTTKQNAMMMYVSDLLVLRVQSAIPEKYVQFGKKCIRLGLCLWGREYPEYWMMDAVGDVWQVNAVNTSCLSEVGKLR